MRKSRIFQALAALLIVSSMLAGAVGCGGPKPIVVVWYPNESGPVYGDTRAEVGKLITQATGRKVEHKFTSEYIFAIQAIAEGTADIAMAMGAVGYVQAKDMNPNLGLLFVNADKNGKLDEAKYFSWICVNKADADKYMSGGSYSIDNIKGKSMSFVSASSTSGFRVPTTLIIDHFPTDNLNSDSFATGGSGKFFSEVMFGGNHQGSAFFLVDGKAEVAAFCDIELANYIELKSGTENTVGAVYAIRQNADAPFNTSVRGNEFVLIAVSPVFNGPNVYNPKNLSDTEIKAIRDLFTSAEVTNNRKIFIDTVANPEAKGLYNIASSKGYVLVSDDWYNAYR